MAASQKSLHQITYTSPVVTKLSWPVLTTLIMAPCAQRRFFLRHGPASPHGLANILFHWLHEVPIPVGHEVT